MITIDVLGCPAPKGSSRAMMIKRKGGGLQAVNVPSGSGENRTALKSWDTAVREAARAQVGPRMSPIFIEKPLRLTIVFRIRRLGSHYRKDGTLKPNAPTWVTVKPDVSKYARATEDSLTGFIWDDDSRITDLRVLKVYAAPGREGATIYVEELQHDVVPGHLELQATDELELALR